MPAVILDACGVLNLYASGRFEQILIALRNDWYIPSAVEDEAQEYRQPSPDDPDVLIAVPIDLHPAISGGTLTRCHCDSDEETELYVTLAARIGDDGESMGLAIAKCRGWSVMTDDKKARRIASELGIKVIGTVEVLKEWSEVTNPSAEELSATLESIERFANYVPMHGTLNCDWWTSSIKSSGR